VRPSPSSPPVVSRLFAVAGLCLLAGTAAPRATEWIVGDGYRSQNSLAQIFAGAGSGDNLHLAWPDGRAAVAAIPDGAKSIKISKPDEVQIVH